MAFGDVGLKSCYRRVRSRQEAYEMNASVEYFSASILDERHRMLRSLGKTWR